LLFKGDPLTVTVSIAAAFAGIIAMAAALQGFVLGIGQIPAHAVGWLARLSMIAGGVLLAVPAPRVTGLSFGANLATGAALAAFGLLILSISLRVTEKEKRRTTP
jgi:hypothetical protein